MITLTENEFTRLNRLARELVNMTEQLARDSRIGQPTRDSHGALMDSIRTATWDLHTASFAAMSRLDWSVVETSVGEA